MCYCCAALTAAQASVWDVDGSGMQQVPDAGLDLALRKVRGRAAESIVAAPTAGGQLTIGARVNLHVVSPKHACCMFV